MRLELASSDEVGVLVRLEIARAHDDRTGMLGRRDAPETSRQAIDEVLLLIGVPTSQLGDRALRIRVLEAAVADECHGMDLDLRRYDEFHSGEAHAVGWKRPPSQCGGRVREV